MVDATPASLQPWAHKQETEIGTSGEADSPQKDNGGFLDLAQFPTFLGGTWLFLSTYTLLPVHAEWQ